MLQTVGNEINFGVDVYRITKGAHTTYRAPVRYVTKTWSVVLLNKKIHILISQVYCVWQVVKTPTIILNKPVFYLHTCGLITGSTVISFSNAPILQNYDPWLLKTDMELGVSTRYRSQSKMFQIYHISPVIQSCILNPVVFLGTDLVIVSSTENYCPIALITYNHFEIGISSYGPELSFPLWRGCP